LIAPVLMRLGSPERLFSELPSKPVLGNPEGKRHKKRAEVLRPQPQIIMAHSL